MSARGTPPGGREAGNEAESYTLDADQYRAQNEAHKAVDSQIFVILSSNRVAAHRCKTKCPFVGGRNKGGGMAVPGAG